MVDFGNTETEKKREEKTGKSREGEESIEKKKRTSGTWYALLFIEFFVHSYIPFYIKKKLQMILMAISCISMNTSKSTLHFYCIH